MNDVIFEFYRGDTYTRDFTITGYKSKIDNIYFTVKENENDKRAMLSKKLNDGITLVDETEDSKTYNLLINCIDTNDFKTNKDYYFDIEIITHAVGGDIRKTILKGTMTLQTDITQPCNEY